MEKYIRSVICECGAGKAPDFKKCFSCSPQKKRKKERKSKNIEKPSYTRNSIKTISDWNNVSHWQDK